MIVTHANKETVTFGELDIGDTFYDADGDLSIKTELAIGCNNAICYVGGSWLTSRWDEDDEVTPIVTELKIIEQRQWRLGNSKHGKNP